MRYLVFVKMAEDVGEAPAALQEAMGAEMARMFADGTMVDAGASADECRAAWRDELAAFERARRPHLLYR